MTMIDLAINWIEMVQVPTKIADFLSNILEPTWMNRCCWPQKIICDRRKEFMAEIKEMLKNDYGCHINQIT